MGRGWVGARAGGGGCGQEEWDGPGGEAGRHQHLSITLAAICPMCRCVGQASKQAGPVRDLGLPRAAQQ